jgi:unsaturated rhamnogalacturonyl hydrolase
MAENRVVQGRMVTPESLAELIEGESVMDAEPIEEAVDQIVVHAKHLQDPHTGLFRHVWHESPDFYPASSYWGRAVGWATAGLIDSIRWLPDDHDAQDQIRDVLRTTCEALLALQDGTGFWHQRLDERQSPLETSGTLMFVYTFKHGLEADVLADERYADAAQRAIEACQGVVDDEGAVHRVAKPPASAFAPLGVTAYGQGWFLLAGECFLQ